MDIFEAILWAIFIIVFSAAIVLAGLILLPINLALTKFKIFTSSRKISAT